MKCLIGSPDRTYRELGALVLSAMVLRWDENAVEKRESRK
jgi:hypothetical protein